MEIFGVGPSELVFILLIAIIVLGPKDMQKAGKTIGRWLNQFIHSDGWKALQRASREIRNLPTNLMREANMEELREMGKDIRQSIDPRHPTGSALPSSASQDPATRLNTDTPPSKDAETSQQPAADEAESATADTEQE
jgi:Sec-independent protein secretion pathway components